MNPINHSQKRLVLIRHAKSSWTNPELRDFDRPLNKRRKENAPELITVVEAIATLCRSEKWGKP